MSPRVPKAEKARILAAALQDAPREFVLFLQAVVKRGRQQLLREIATGVPRPARHQAQPGPRRRHAGAAGRREAAEQAIQDALSQQLGKEVIASFSVDPEILGGAVVRVGERIHDGSVRRRMTKLRRQLLSPS